MQFYILLDKNNASLHLRSCNKEC